MDMESRIESIKADPTVADEDQQRARALEFLRKAPEYVLAVPAPEEGEFSVRVIIDCDVGFMGRSALTIANAANAAAEELDAA